MVQQNVFQMKQGDSITGLIVGHRVTIQGPDKPYHNIQSHLKFSIAKIDNRTPTIKTKLEEPMGFSSLTH
jgi:hypothetical protein